MKKLMTLTLVCLIIVSSSALADTSSGIITRGIPISDKPPSAIIPDSSIPEPMLPIDYRGYTGFKIFYNKELKDGKVTMQAYHMKMNNKDMFMYFVQYCTYSDGVGTCGFLSSNGWIEGKVAGKNWIIRDGDFNAILGQKIGNIRSGSWHALLNIE